MSINLGDYACVACQECGRPIWYSTEARADADPEVACEDCGAHPAIYCPYCGQANDLIYAREL